MLRGVSDDYHPWRIIRADGRRESDCIEKRRHSSGKQAARGRSFAFWVHVIFLNSTSMLRIPWSLFRVPCTRNDQNERKRILVRVTTYAWNGKRGGSDISFETDRLWINVWYKSCILNYFTNVCIVTDLTFTFLARISYSFPSKKYLFIYISFSLFFFLIKFTIIILNYIYRGTF